MDVSIAMTLVIFVAAKVIRALIFESYSFSYDKTDLYLGYLKLMLKHKNETSCLCNIRCGNSQSSVKRVQKKKSSPTSKLLNQRIENMELNRRQSVRNLNFKSSLFR